MAVYKDGDKWRVIYRYTNYKGERKQTQKRGFVTKREAVAWEHEVMLRSESKLDMTFSSFFEIYEEDKKKRVKENTWESKSHIIRTKILPFFGERKIAEIEPKDVIAWQNELLAYKGENGEVYSPTYLKTIHSQLSAIFNHAVRYYHLPSNPAQKAGSMGSEEHKEMLFWTKEEYLKFADAMMDKPISYYAFEMLYWTGIRCGELLALTPNDFNFERQELIINKSYQRLNCRDVITTPKTKKSNRTIKMPKFLCEEMQEYIGMLYEIGEDERLFQITKSYLHHEMDRGAKVAGVKRIRIHDLRHTAIYQREQQLDCVEKELAGAKGIFKAKQRKELQEQAEQLQTQIASMKQYLSSIVQGYGYKNVKEFMAEFKASKAEYADYQSAVARWKQQTGNKAESDSMKARLHRKQQEVQERENNRQSYHYRSDRGGR